MTLESFNAFIFVVSDTHVLFYAFSIKHTQTKIINICKLIFASKGRFNRKIKKFLSYMGFWKIKLPLKFTIGV